MTWLNTHRRSNALTGAALAVGVAALLVTAGPAYAQDEAEAATKGAMPTTREPQTRSPFWDDPYSRDRRPDDRRSRDRYDDEETFAESFPVDLAALVAPARERYMALKWGYKTARERLGDRVDELRRAFEDEEEYRSLRRERDELQRSAAIARQQALEPLRDDPEYQALSALQQELEAQIRRAHQSSDRDMEQIRAMSELAMDYARQRREKEAQQLSRAGLTATDSSVESSRQRLREIQERERELEEEFDRELRNDQELASLRDEIQQLRIAYLAAGAYYDSTVRTANIAADFAYFNALTRSFSSYSPYSPYGGYGFPFGHGRFHGGLVVGGIGTIDTGTGPVRLRPVLFPSPIISNTMRGLNHTPIPSIPTGNDPPPIPLPDE